MAAKSLPLGADVWTVLTTAAVGLDLPFPFRPDDAPLEPTDAAAAEQALRNSPLIVGDSGDLIADLHPALQASLGVHALPAVVIDAWVGLGDDLCAGRYASAADLASGFTRELRAVSGGTELGPVSWHTMELTDLVPAILAPLGEIAGHPSDAEPLELDAAVALAITRAIQAEQPEIAAELAGGPAPAPLPAAAAGLQKIARIDATGANGRTVLLLFQTDDRWWQASLAGELLDLEPQGRGGVLSTVAELVAGALTSPAAAR